MPQPFYIAGIGASAGGHEALGEFFRHLPPQPGIAFCVVTHLLRGHYSALDRILSKYTDMRVQRMTEGDYVQPDNVYVMPEGVMAYLRNGHIVLKDRLVEDVINRTVDEFFFSLAEDQKDRCIGIIFSGMGDDGARGVQLIHEQGGIVLVQEPDSTPFKSMPQNAIRRDHPNKILPPAMLATSILDEIGRKNVAHKVS